MRINNNLMAMNTHRQYSVNTLATSKSIEKLSSGLRIGRAGDDAAGLAICEKMRSQIRGMNQAARNAQDGISLIQTAEGGLGQTHSLLQRMRELSVQSASDTNTAVERSSLQLEFDQLTDEIDDIANNTKFNGMNLLNVGGSSVSASVTTTTTGASFGVIQGDSGNGVISLNQVVPSEAGSLAQWTFDITNGGAFSQGTGIMQFMGVTLSIDVIGGGDPAGVYSATSPVSSTVTFDENATTDDVAGGIVAALTDLSNSFGGSSPINGFTFAATGNQIMITAPDADDAYNTRNVNFTSTSNGITTADLALPTTLNAAEQLGTYSFVIDKAIEAVGATINLGGETFTAVESGATGNQFNIGTDAGAQAQSLVDAINANNNLNTRFTANAVGGAITLTEKTGQATGVDLTDLTLAGNTPVAGEYTFPLGTSIPDGGRYTIDGVDIAVTIDAGDAGIAAGTSVLYNADPDTMAANLSTAIANNAALSAKYMPSASGNVITLTQPGPPSSMTAPVVTASTSDATGFDIELQVGAGPADSLELTIASMTGAAIGVETLNISTRNGASTAITAIDTAVNMVSGERSKMGALQNRLGHKISSLGTTGENLTAAESRIRDVDMAHEMMMYTKDNILVQAATAMLAQANQAPQAVLQLLQ